MARENSFSDSDGRSLTPDLEDEDDMIGQSAPASSSRDQTSQALPVFEREQSDTFGNLEASLTPTMVMSASGVNGVLSEEPESNVRPKLSDTMAALASTPPTARAMTTPSRPGAGLERFRASARKIMHMHRGSSAIAGTFGVGAEPGVDPRKSSAFIQYGHIRAKSQIEVIDYSSLRSSFEKFENKGFLEYLSDQKVSSRGSWVKVRWINVAGISWDVISALALKHGSFKSAYLWCNFINQLSQIFTLLLWRTSFMVASSHVRNPIIT